MLKEGLRSRAHGHVLGVVWKITNTTFAIAIAKMPWNWAVYDNSKLLHLQKQYIHCRHSTDCVETYRNPEPLAAGEEVRPET